MKPHLVVFTGAGVSADSGLSTFRDADGYWDKYRIEDVCTHEAILLNRPLVIDFYNQRRREILAAQPNAAHLAIAELEKYFRVDVITQNIDDLHERAGSTSITHLHGEITKLRSSNDELATVPCPGTDQPLDARHPDGSLLRPYIVFFGEGVPLFPKACEIASEADIFVVVGTSLNVYPAASLLQYVGENVPIYFVDPGQPKFGIYANRISHIQKKAAQGVPELCQTLIEKYK
ncbi:MAG: NAD-dependent deacylase [Paludibacteraceae bacterium]|mgnify:CR=1 FL=1|nr:NAD-dependent deacylase [Paludibacteraceae bacterium]